MRPDTQEACSITVSIPLTNLHFSGEFSSVLTTPSLPATKAFHFPNTKIRKRKKPFLSYYSKSFRITFTKLVGLWSVPMAGKHMSCSDKPGVGLMPTLGTRISPAQCQSGDRCFCKDKWGPLTRRQGSRFGQALIAAVYFSSSLNFGSNSLATLLCLF